MPRDRRNGVAPGVVTRTRGPSVAAGKVRGYRLDEVVYREVQTGNCVGMIPNGNCAGNPLWSMPDTNWWTWGLGFGYVNPGWQLPSTVTNEPVTQVNVRNVGAYALHSKRPVFDIQQRGWNNCNCGTTNCYNACNCNCNCACDCTQCGDCMCCFLAGTQVTMADGSQRNIEDIRVGDMLMGAFGEINEVLALMPTTVGANRMHSINGELVITADHPILAPSRQFCAIDPGLLGKGMNATHPVITAGGFDQPIDGAVTRRYAFQDVGIVPLSVGMELLQHDQAVAVERIDDVDLHPDTPLFNLAMGGSHTYRVQGFVVSGWPQDDFDFRNWKAKS